MIFAVFIVLNLFSLEVKYTLPVSLVPSHIVEDLFSFLDNWLSLLYETIITTLSVLSSLVKTKFLKWIQLKIWPLKQKIG